jgi:hypothetical protein
MHLETLAARQPDVLAGIARVEDVRGFYLAGGTALALRYGHRESIDFDFFRAESFDILALDSALTNVFGPHEIIRTAESTLHVRLLDVSASFFRLPYPLLETVEPTAWGFGLASSRDLAAMKLEAIASRGSRKDFVDLRWLCLSGMTLEEAFEAHDAKYGLGRSERYHRLRALSFFDDAEGLPMPKMLVPFDWEQAKDWFRREAKRLLAAGIVG